MTSKKIVTLAVIGISIIAYIVLADLYGGHFDVVYSWSPRNNVTISNRNTAPNTVYSLLPRNHVTISYRNTAPNTVYSLSPRNHVTISNRNTAPNTVYSLSPRNHVTISNRNTAPNKTISNITAVIILTYMRSGSSLTGDILQHSPDAFYVFEPLHAYSKTIERALPINLTYVNGSTRLWPFDFPEASVDVMRNWLNCDINRLPIPSLFNGFLEKGIKSKVFRSCYRKRHSDGNSRMQKCAEELKSVCEQSPVRILKTIRVSLNLIGQLLAELPWLKIVHLVRDPHATLQSQKMVGMCTKERGGIQGCVSKHCNRQEKDLIEAERLADKYPGQLLRVYYEDIAAKPIETSRKMFHFIGTTFTMQAEEYIFNITLAGKADNGVIGTTRRNSSEHIDIWKKTMKADFLNATETLCGNLLRRLNYSLTEPILNSLS